MAIVPLTSPEAKKKKSQDMAKRARGGKPVPMAPQKPKAKQVTPKPKSINTPKVKAPSMIDGVKPKPKYTVIPRKISPRRTPRMGNR
jgi:hypothetical protein